MYSTRGRIRDRVQILQIGLEAVSRTSLGSIQILRAPQFNTDAARRFCNFNETMVQDFAS
jgi:hypothetical protein